jgi:hypothetical protein
LWRHRSGPARARPNARAAAPRHRSHRPPLRFTARYRSPDEPLPGGRPGCNSCAYPT